MKFVWTFRNSLWRKKADKTSVKNGERRGRLQLVVIVKPLWKVSEEKL